MRVSLCIGATALLVLASCGGSEDKTDSKDASAPKTASADASGMKLDPGQWEVTMETLSMEAPGMPKEAMAAMGGGQKMTVKNCVTPEQAEKPSADLFSAKQDANCTT